MRQVIGKKKIRRKLMRAQDKEKERKWNDDFVKRTGGYDTYDDDLSQLFDIFQISSLSKESLVLDAGCGTGKCSIPFAKLGFKVIGVDISEKAIEVACQKAEEAKLSIIFRVEDLEALPFEDNTFDIVFCGGVLHHFPSLNKVEEELHRVLKEKGKLFAYEANRSNPITFLFFTFANLSRKFLPLGCVKRKFSVNESALNVKELEGSLRNAGFTDFYFDSINIRNKGKNNSQMIWGNIRNLIFFLCEKFLPRLSKGIHIILSCVKERKYK